MMKVLYCSPVFLDYRLPFLKELVRLFDGQFYVMYSPNRYHLMKRNALCAKVKEELGENACPFMHDYMFDTATKSFHRMEMEYGQKIPFMYGFLYAIRKIKPKVLVTEAFFQWTPWCLLYSFLFRIPLLISYERTCYTERECGKLKKMYRKIVDLFTRGYLVNGIETQKYLESIGVRPEKIFRIGMSADSKGLTSAIASFEHDERIAFKKQFVNESTGLLYLFSGQIVKRKGVDHLLAAWIEHIEHYPYDKLVLIGYGDMYENLKNQYKNQSSIYLEGKVDYNDVYKYYAIADVFVLPTIEDNWSLVIPEAMSCGLPVTTSIYNGCYPELIHENGITFDSYDKTSIVAALAYFHHHDLKIMGEKSKKIENMYNTEHCAKRMYNAIMNL